MRLRAYEKDKKRAELLYSHLSVFCPRPSAEVEKKIRPENHSFTPVQKKKKKCNWTLPETRCLSSCTVEIYFCLHS